MTRKEGRVKKLENTDCVSVICSECGEPLDDDSRPDICPGCKVTLDWSEYRKGRQRRRSVKKASEMIKEAFDEICEVAYEYCDQSPHYFDKIENAMNQLEEVMDILEAPPRWETPEQREKRTGDKYPDRAPVWCADNDDPADPWFLDYYENAVEDERYYIICAVGGLVPPDGWRPEEEAS